jgi:hypothetical protein
MALYELIERVEAERLLPGTIEAVASLVRHAGININMGPGPGVQLVLSGSTPPQTINQGDWAIRVGTKIVVLDDADFTAVFRL